MSTVDTSCHQVSMQCKYHCKMAQWLQRVSGFQQPGHQDVSCGVASPAGYLQRARQGGGSGPPVYVPALSRVTRPAPELVRTGPNVQPNVVLHMLELIGPSLVGPSLIGSPWADRFPVCYVVWPEQPEFSLVGPDISRGKYPTNSRGKSC